MQQHLAVQSAPESPQPARDAATAGLTPLPRRSRLPLGFILVSLVLLAVLPALSNRFVQATRQEVRNLIEPARKLTTDVHMGLALSSAALRDFLNTKDTLFLYRYETEVAQERAAYDSLAPLVVRLEPEVQQNYQLLRQAEGQWHQRVAALLRQRPHDTEAIQDVLADEETYEETVVAAAQLDAALGHAATLRRQRVDRADRIVLIMTIGLATLAGAAALVAVALGRRLHSYALAAETGRRDLQEVIESKARLTRGITHDLKNPLGVILGNAQLMQEGLRGELTAEQRISVNRIESASTSMLELINTLLELEQARAATLSIGRSPVLLPELVSDVSESHRATAQHAGLSLDVRVQPELGWVETDRARVTQVLDNLLTNAIKYTPAGGVQVRATVDGAGAPTPGDWIAIAVQDTGRGIPTAQQERIFDEFSRLETEHVQGAGLGLAISRRIARLLGGEITVRSTPGLGSTFTFWLPK
jgi:signal transduction histidine kinase